MSLEFTIAFYHGKALGTACLKRCRLTSQNGTIGGRVAALEWANRESSIYWTAPLLARLFVSKSADVAIVVFSLGLPLVLERFGRPLVSCYALIARLVNGSLGRKWMLQLICSGGGV